MKTLLHAIFPSLLAIGIANADIAIQNVNVIPMTPNGAVMKDVTVIVRKDRIESITPSATTKLDPKLPVITARDQWLIPGLADMHAHLENDRLLRLYAKDPNVPPGTTRTADILLPYIANGVTQITVLTAMPETIAQRDEVEAGRVLGPHIALAAMIDGATPIWPIGMTRSAATPSDGRQAVRDAQAEGYDFIKAYERLDVDTWTAIMDEARKLDMKVIGHLPANNQGLTEKFFVPGFSMVAHAEEIAQQANPPATDRIGDYVQWAKRNGTWVTSTLTVDERIVEMMKDPSTLRSRPELRYWSPSMQRFAIDNNPYLKNASPGAIAYVERVVAFNRKLIAALVAAGVPVVAGTDALLPGIIGGFGMHDELELLTQAGMTNEQALAAATRLPADWLGTLADRGEVVAGKRADLVLLDGDPLKAIANTRRIAGVIVNGKYVSRTELDSRMRALANANRVN
jgi:imidazolonepropionase-like amidohydrolase